MATIPDLFDSQSAAPMLIASETDPFDDPGYDFELKLDGDRCLAYLGAKGAELINKRGRRMISQLPELAQIHRQVGQRCILDGELVVLGEGGRPDFTRLRRRVATSNGILRQLAAEKEPAAFVAFDILYLGTEATGSLPLERRRDLLSQNVEENERLSLARYVPCRGRAFFERIREQGLEGLIAKKRDSRYRFGRRTSDWVKIKNQQDDDYVICGYIMQWNHVASLLLGQYDRSGKLTYKGRVVIAASREDFRQVLRLPERETYPYGHPPNTRTERAIWVEPRLVCTVEFVCREDSGLMRQPTYKGLRPDKAPEDTLDHSNRRQP